ncbi:Flp family type IVb pilin [Sphingomonas sp. G-3-2-10]|nr:Flp family type IVb pilin [Sphingomonas sp. G-3-2-10]NML04431.1 Flp family type IVb pilin [Sphingomonas sp. G-3-2-10]
MRAIVRLVGKLFRDRRAATAVEYGFILALVVIAMIATLRELAGTTTGMWTNVSTKVQATN